MEHKRRTLRAAYTVEAAGVMAAVLFTVMVIIRVAFVLRAEVCGSMAVHRQVEQQRHAIANQKEDQIMADDNGNGWSISISAPVFRPEDSLRMWSILEGKQ